MCYVLVPSRFPELLKYSSVTSLNDLHFSEFFSHCTMFASISRGRWYVGIIFHCLQRTIIGPNCAISSDYRRFLLIIINKYSENSGNIQEKSSWWLDFNLATPNRIYFGQWFSHFHSDCRGGNWIFNYSYIYFCERNWVSLANWFRRIH